MKTVAYFISGHGFGHGVRSCAVINALPREYRIFIFSGIPSRFFAEELQRDYRLFTCELDCGCVQSDTLRVDISATIKQYTALNSRRDAAIGYYSRLLTDLGVDLALADIPPLAFPIAAAAGIPCYAVTNFTWADIYHPYTRSHPEFTDIVHQICSDYSQGEALFSLYPGMEGLGFTEKRDVGLVSRLGQNRRPSLARQFNLDIRKKWCLVYIGSFGLEGVQWKNLGDYGDWEFLGLYPFSGAPGNYHCLPKIPGLNYADLTASSDLVFGKLGYGLISECLSHGVPVLFFERFDFAEYQCLKEAFLERDQGLELELLKVKNLDFLPEIERLSGTSYEPIEANGIENIVKALEIA